jgi:hypothetical protein
VHITAHERFALSLTNPDSMSSAGGRLLAARYPGHGRTVSPGHSRRQRSAFAS